MDNIKIAVILIPILHYIGDYVLQLRKYAIRKTEPGVLFAHVLIYGACLTPIFFLVPHLYMLGWICVNMVFHFAMDFITSRMERAAFLEKGGYQSKEFWIILGWDQTVHICILLVTYINWVR